MGVSTDRFSSLPDSLLSTIVSFLPFKEAVRTSILSKSWLNICKATSNVEFNELFFVKHDQPDGVREAQRRAFLDFTTFWIDNHRETVLDKFSLRLTMPENVGEVMQRCIAFATQHGVKELELDLTYPTWNNDNFYYDIYEAMAELPQHVYGHSRLEHLKLFSCNFVAAELHKLRALKEVSFGWMKVSLTAIKALLSSCKMIESLSLTKCWNNSDDFDFGDENLSLRKLVIDKCHFKFNIFKVNAPNLRFFSYCGLMTLFVIEIRSLSMEEANLDFSLEYGFQGHGPFLYKLVHDLYTARVFTVCSYLLQVIPTGGPRLRMRHNMNVRHLILKTALDENEFMGITFLLNSCPMLECLTIEIGFAKFLYDYEERFNINHERFWIDTARVYKCMRTTLKEVEIKGFKGTANELCVLSYLIVRGEVLKKISINILKDDAAGDNENGFYHRRQAAEMMLMLPRASSDLELSIC